MIGKTLRLLILLLSVPLFAAELPTQFAQRAMAHIEHLADLGNRAAGTANERKAIAYIEAQMKQAGLQTAVEPFSYHSFEFEKAALSIGGKTVTPEMVAYDDFGPLKMEAPAPEDLPAAVKPENLEGAARVVAGVVEHLR